MPSFATVFLRFAVAAVGACPMLVHADDTDALALQSAPQVPDRERPFRLFVEGALGVIGQRGGLGSRSTHRASIDYSQSFQLASGWRFNLSDRLDEIQPPGFGVPSTLNSLREAIVGWRPNEGETIFEVGRVNVRNGPSYGYNPTDYFRTGALRASTTVDPFALRENRLGTVMVRAQRLWSGGGASLSLAPKLADAENTGSFAADWGATNSRDKVLATWSAKLSDRISGQALLYGEKGVGGQLGASLTALLSDAAVGHLEVSRGRDEDSWAMFSGGSTVRNVRNRLTTGLTYSFVQQLSVTAEFEYNGFAPSKDAWRQAGSSGAPFLGAYLLDAQRRQDNASRNAWLIYASQKSVIVKNVDTAALLRINADDGSRLAWIEVRRHWNGWDGALQWQSSHGGGNTQYGQTPARNSLQALVSVYF